mmetsp:Transcript_29496/g.84815  ORF Transcript_29496/g.84815 Transcript_29496/m.84815 type:complete len:504 (-) Transcript_29496:44-1555(-)
MTHLAQSDVMLLVGRPDGRIGTLAASEGATIMSTQQARYICSRPSRGIEAISIGHNPWAKQGLFTRAVVLPTDERPMFLSQQLLGTESGAFAPGDVVAASAAYIESTREVSATGFEPFGWVTKDILRHELAKLNVPEDRISMDDAFAVISNIVKARAGILDIDADGFDAHEVCVAWLRRHRRGPFSQPGTPNTESSPTLPPTSSWGVPSMVTPTSWLQAVKQGFRLKSAGAGSGVSLSDLLAVLRGRRMNAHIRALQLSRKSKLVKEHVQAHDQMMDALKGVKKCFDAWAEFASHSKAPGELVATTTSEVPSAEWRVQEEFRRRRRQHFMGLKAVGLEAKVLHAWRKALKEDMTPLKAYLTGTPPKSHLSRVTSPCKKAFGGVGDDAQDGQEFLPIGGRMAGQAADGHEMLEGVRPLERLYETRVAAAERLMASYVILHRAVKPLSKLRFLRYDLDRSESRLRVASTPAPVPFVEELPECIEEAGMVSVTSEEKVSGQVLYTV